MDQLTHLPGDRRYGGAQSEAPTSETVYIYICTVFTIVTIRYIVKHTFCTIQYNIINNDNSNSDEHIIYTIYTFAFTSM